MRHNDAAALVGGGRADAVGVALIRPEEQLQRFIQRAVKDSETGCWNWIGSDNGHGYSRFWDGKKTQYAHRFSYTAHHGPIPDGLNVCHSCDNRRCVNPDHLWLGTAADNVHDAMRKKRNVPPPPTKWKEQVEPHHWARLTREQVIEIKRALAAGEKMGDIAKRYGVGRTAIEKIRLGQRWSHVHA
jgi:hypothetical protein